MTSIRIVTVDYYMSYPVRDLDVKYSEFRGTEVKQVPIIQVFGSLREGHKTCLNIHGVFPYIYIPYDGSEPAGILSYKIAAELDKALNTSLGQSSSNAIHVHDIVLVYRRPIYGFHKNQHQFFKIYFYNPAILKKACSLLDNGAVLGKSFQPYECHINYILQFMIDYNLHGMNMINISKVMYRASSENPDLLQNIPPDLILSNDIQRRSVCKFEFDALASSILNKNEIEPGKQTVNPGIAALWEDEKQRKRNKGKDSQISFCLTQDRNEIPPTKSHSYFTNLLTERLLRKSDESSLDLDNSVYPVETPEDTDIFNDSVIDHTILDTSFLNETICQNVEYNEDDMKLLKILQDLKENAEVEEDSVLSQHLPLLDESVEEEEQNLSLSLQEVVVDDDANCQNSFWAECDNVPQIDGQYDTDSSDSEGFVEIRKKEPKYSKFKDVYRIASEVYLDGRISNDIPESKKLERGMNKLIAIGRNSSLSKKKNIKIISDVCIKSAENIAGNNISEFEQLCIEENFNETLNNNEIKNEVIINDVNLCSSSPHNTENIVESTLEDFLKEESNLASAPPSPQSLENLNELLFNDFDIQENKNGNKKSQHKLGNSQKKKCAPVKQPKKYNLRDITQKSKKTCKCCLSDINPKSTEDKNEDLDISLDILNISQTVENSPKFSQNDTLKRISTPKRDKENTVINDNETKMARKKSTGSRKSPRISANRKPSASNRAQTKLSGSILTKLKCSKNPNQFEFFDEISLTVPEQILENDPVTDKEYSKLRNNGNSSIEIIEVPIENQINELPIDFNLLVENWTLNINSGKDEGIQNQCEQNNDSPQINEISIKENINKCTIGEIDSCKQNGDLTFNKLKEENNNYKDLSLNSLTEMTDQIREIETRKDYEKPSTKNEKHTTLFPTVEISPNSVCPFTNILKHEKDHKLNLSTELNSSIIEQTTLVSSDEILTRNKPNWNLDGQDDTSDSLSPTEETATKKLKDKIPPEIYKKKNETSCRSPGLSKKSVKSRDKKKPDNYINLLSSESNPDTPTASQNKDIKNVKNRKSVDKKKQSKKKSKKAIAKEKISDKSASTNYLKKDLQIVLTPLPSLGPYKTSKKPIHVFSTSEEEDEITTFNDSFENKIKPNTIPQTSAISLKIDQEDMLSLSSSSEEVIVSKNKHLRKKPVAKKPNPVQNLKMKKINKTKDKLTQPVVQLTRLTPEQLSGKSTDSEIIISSVSSTKTCQNNNKISTQDEDTILIKNKLLSPDGEIVISPASSVGVSEKFDKMSIDCVDNIVEECKLVSVKKTAKNGPSAKYSPLNVVRSPRKRSTLDPEDEPLAKRLRSNIEGITPLLRSDKNEKGPKNARGVGELKNIPLLLKKSKKPAPLINNDVDVPQVCDIVVSNCQNVKSPTSIENEPPNFNSNLNTTLSEEFLTCSFKSNPKSESLMNLKYIDKMRNKEDQFLEEFGKNECTTNYINEQNKNINNNIASERNNNPEIIETSNISKITNDNIIEQNNNSEQSKTVVRIVKKKDKKPVSNFRRKELNYVYFSPVIKPSSKNNPNNIKQTLSQQNENELCFIDKYNTKTIGLTEAEKYDLAHDFAPQPCCSKNIVPENDFLNDSFLPELTFMDNTQVFDETLILDKTITYNISRIWMPKYLPPSRDDIKNTLSVYNIPENRFQEPFYSDFSDVTGKVDIGHNVLKILSNTAADQLDFESCLDFVGIEKWRETKFNELYPSDTAVKNIKATLAGHKNIIITPVIQPPTRKDILKWISSENNKTEAKRDRREKPKILIQHSPDNSNDSFNESLTITPCTPESTKLSPVVIESSQSTPVSSQSSRKLRNHNSQLKTVIKSQIPHRKIKLLNIQEEQSSNDSCQITGVTLNNTHGFRMSLENLQAAKAISEHQNLTVLVLELHIRTRGDYYPDPQYDSVRAIFYSILNDVPEYFELPQKETGVIVVDTLPGSPLKNKKPILDGTGIKCVISYVKSELELIEEFVKLVRKWDPDIFTGFEIEMLSWGYLIERCAVIGINLPIQISRTNPAVVKNKENKQQDELKLTGRIILDGWRLFRHEIALQSYTFENLMFHILHKRIPAHSFKNLSFWWEHRMNYYRSITANYYITKVEGMLKLLDQLDLIGRTCELARLFGIQFYEVLSRGSQFRVESMMLRLAKPQNFVPVSPSVQQRGRMRAPEWIPLILEPESRFYADPVIVLDFQSLYPSIIIAYNYCFSTCIGRVDKLGGNSPFEFGACQLKVPRNQVEKLEGKLNFSPCGVGFVQQQIRIGVLPQMLTEILETRLMVKASMKENKNDKILQRVLHNRQLGLKLIANVTYGYTSANFSGRMPCMEVGDSVVSKGRETLERAIESIEKNEKWRARVVYGDTDSLFVLVQGRTREEAFKIGAEIAEAVTNDNPPPVKLKLEKVYQPCILQTKKRYVGYMYESAEQKEAEYNAKGIETVRRDGCPAVAKMLEKTLRLLFETRNMSIVKRYVLRQFEKILSGRASFQDLIFAREFRGSSGYRPGACVPALELSRRWTAFDKRREPRRGERVPYVVVHGPPGVPLIRLVKSPMELLNPDQNVSLRPNAIYYITRVIAPPLNRCLGLIGADVLAWFNEMPRKQLHILPTEVHFANNKKSTISQYFATMSCVVCGKQTKDGLCENCCANSQQSLVVLHEKLLNWERSSYEVEQICQSCCGRLEYTECISMDCPVLYRLHQTKRDLRQVPFVRNLLSKFS